MIDKLDAGDSAASLHPYSRSISSPVHVVTNESNNNRFLRSFADKWEKNNLDNLPKF